MFCEPDRPAVRWLEIGEVNCGDGPEAERQGEGARREGARERSQQDAR